MQFAVSISSNDIITGSQCKNRDRISPWFQFLSLIAFLGFQGNPFDIVFIFSRTKYVASLNVWTIVVLLQVYHIKGLLYEKSCENYVSVSLRDYET